MREEELFAAYGDILRQAEAVAEAATLDDVESARATAVRIENLFYLLLQASLLQLSRCTACVAKSDCAPHEHIRLALKELGKW